MNESLPILPIELLKIDVVKADFVRGELHLSFDYLLNQRPLGSFARLHILKPERMMAQFEKQMGETPQAIGKGIQILDRDRVNHPMRAFFKKFFDARAKHIEGSLTDEEKAILNTNGIDLKDSALSLDQKSIPEKIEIFMNQARVLVEGRYYFLALERFEKILRLNPNFGAAYYYKGVCHQALKEMEEAEVAFRTWKSFSPKTDREPYFYLGKVLLELHRYQDALSLYDEYFECFPDDAMGFLWKAQIFFKLRHKKYLRWLDRAFLKDETAVREFLGNKWDYDQPGPDRVVWLTPKLARAFLHLTEDDFAQLVKEHLIPSHFDENECKYSFRKDELEFWAELTARYKVFERIYRTDLHNLKEEIQNTRVARRRADANVRRRRNHRKYLPPSAQTTFIFGP